MCEYVRPAPQTQHAHTHTSALSTGFRARGNALGIKRAAATEAAADTRKRTHITDNRYIRRANATHTNAATAARLPFYYILYIYRYYYYYYYDVYTYKRYLSCTLYIMYILFKTV